MQEDTCVVRDLSQDLILSNRGSWLSCFYKADFVTDARYPNPKSGQVGRQGECKAGQSKRERKPQGELVVLALAWVLGVSAGDADVFTDLTHIGPRSQRSREEGPGEGRVVEGLAATHTDRVNQEITTAAAASGMN